MFDRSDSDGEILGLFLEAMVIGSAERVIKNQEARGQSALVRSSVLPKQGPWDVLEAMGIVRGEEQDDLFVQVTLPEGWHKRATNHSMWSDLIDEHGRNRASIFYKAAFYDRAAHITPLRRYSAGVRPEGGWANRGEESGWVGEVTDWDGTVLWQSEPLEAEPPYRYGDGEEERQVWLGWRDRKYDLVNQAKAWLNEHYPDNCNPVAYWQF